MPLKTIQCSGCEAECEVVVEVRDGHARCLGGNNCPTGESFACARAQSDDAPDHPDDNNKLKTP